MYRVREPSIHTQPEMSYTVIIISTGSIRVDIGGQSKLIKNSADKRLLLLLRVEKIQVAAAAARLLQHRADSSSKHRSHLVFYLLNFVSLIFLFFFSYENIVRRMNRDQHFTNSFLLQPLFFYSIGIHREERPFVEIFPTRTARKSFVFLVSRLVSLLDDYKRRDKKEKKTSKHRGKLLSASRSLRPKFYDPERITGKRIGSSISWNNINGAKRRDLSLSRP